MDSKNEAKTARALRRVSCGEGNACFFSVLDKGGEMPPTSLRRQKPDPKDSFCLALVRGREGRARLWVGSAKKLDTQKRFVTKRISRLLYTKQCVVFLHITAPAFGREAARMMPETAGGIHPRMGFFVGFQDART
ncbi:TPA: hypothetical protein ACKRML_005089 [Pseudomonas aeruginosa]|uniref:hypothetical protein n=1 Tax=Pseudomonas aeruginosa TaxID=287 RepID=UPI0011433BBD|nr:hypothetical protein [Pseudomonas aeruginosa]MBH4114756.1 hypothetical protein [Pseudomonas aeruginosa]HCF3942908.1 hypothetical protein [Pseudomonas aeruginosa]HCR1821473.1 hypothetical protein [Pseudomonas aeruginosa]HEK3507829.1 hypothetical protein [Pseudomonas aeruginosa]